MRGIFQKIKHFSREKKVCYHFERVLDIPYRHFFAHRLFECDVWRVDALYPCKTSFQQRFAVANLTCYQPDRNPCRAVQDALWKFAHQGLAICGTFACNNEIGVLEESFESNGIQQ